MKIRLMLSRQIEPILKKRNGFRPKRLVVAGAPGNRVCVESFKENRIIDPRR
jgi:hypothetical protein